MNRQEWDKLLDDHTFIAYYAYSLAQLDTY
jgi:hypothetical protein